MKIYVNKIIASKMILDFTSRVSGTEFKLTDLKPIDVYAFVLADTFMAVDAELHDMDVALNRAIERANILGEDNFKSFVEDNKDVVVRW